MSDAKYLILASGLLSGIYDVKRFVYVQLCAFLCVFTCIAVCVCLSVRLSVCLCMSA